MIKKTSIKGFLTPLIAVGSLLAAPVQVILLMWSDTWGQWAIPMLVATFFFPAYTVLHYRFSWREDRVTLCLAFIPTLFAPALGLLGLMNQDKLIASISLVIGILHSLSVYLFFFWIPKIRPDVHGLKVGKKMSPFVFDDISSNPLTNSILGNGPILFFFFRGNWCPFCSTQLKELVEGYRKIEDTGLRLAFVSSQPQEEMKVLSEKHGLDFLYMVDRDNGFARENNLLDEDGVPPGLRRFGQDTLLPTLVFVDHRERILLVEKTDNVRLRSDPQKILEQVRLLGMTSYLEEKVSERTKDLERERDKSEKLLLNILPEHTATELREKGRTEARLYDEVSILYADFVGFSKLTAELSPQEVLDAVNEYFEAYDGAVEELGLEKIKTIGDAYMVAAGVPSQLQDHALRCSQLGFEILNINERLRRLREGRGQIFFSCRVGVHSGPVMAGVAGKTKFCYDIWGKSVNMAARIESHGEPDQLNISKATLDLLPKTVKSESRGSIEVKNMGSQEMFFLHSLN